MRLRPALVLVSALATACSGGGSNGETSGGSGGSDEGGAAGRCASADVDCFLEALTLSEAGGAPVLLTTLDGALLAASRPAPTPPAVGARSVWSVGVGTLDGWDGREWWKTDVGGESLNDVWTASLSDAWAVGAGGRILRWDGSSWVTVSAATPGALSLEAVWGSSPNDVWVAGGAGRAAHWDGATWSPVGLGTSVQIDAIGGTSASDIWMVGAGGTILHFDGNVWSNVASNTLADLSSLWVGGPGEAWAGGSGELVHWNGVSWAPMASTGYTSGIWGSGPSDVWAIGYEITQGTILFHWDGSAWQPRPDPATLSEFNAIWGRSATDAWIAGSGGMAHYDGVSWSFVPASPGAHRAIHGIAEALPGRFPPVITQQPAPMTFVDAKTEVDFTLEWTDPNGCTPSFCFRVCTLIGTCSTRARCSPIVHDDRYAGATIRTMGYRAEPADSSAVRLALDVVPIASPDCEDPIARLREGNAQVTLGVDTVVEQTVLPPAGASGAGGSGAGSSATITANPNAVSMTATTCYPSQCTVSQTITITSSTPWTSSPPGFGSLGEGFLVSPDTGPTGSTPVTISYTASVPAPADGFIRFRASTIGVYAEVPVTVLAK